MASYKYAKSFSSTDRILSGLDALSITSNVETKREKVNKRKMDVMDNVECTDSEKPVERLIKSIKRKLPVVALFRCTDRLGVVKPAEPKPSTSPKESCKPTPLIKRARFAIPSTPQMCPHTIVYDINDEIDPLHDFDEDHDHSIEAISNQLINKLILEECTNKS